MSDRPGWVRALQHYVGDEIIDHPAYPQDGTDDRILTDVQAAMDDVLCARFGHEIIDDQCMIPAHRYCVHCGRLESSVAAGTEIDRLRDYAGRLRVELARHGWGDFHYGTQPQDPAIVALLAEHHAGVPLVPGDDPTYKEWGPT